MSIRDQLAAKARRRATQLVQVSDPALAQARAAAAHARIAVAPDGEADEQLVADAAQADLDVLACFTPVEFQAMHPRDFEALLAAHTGDDGEVDRESLRPALAAASAVDEDLQDPQWWAEQFASGTWSKGEIDDLYALLFVNLNYSVPQGGYTKG